MNELGVYKISWNELEFAQEIGRGSFCRVYHGHCRGMDVAIRILLKPLDSADEIEAFHREVKLMRFG
jgi:serine/threonine protein kinase